MTPWLPIIATIVGALIAGSASFLVHWSSNRHARSVLQLNLANERAKWATERKLESIHHFYKTIEKLIEAAGHFRAQQAWQDLYENDGTPLPSWLQTYDTARKGIEDALHAANSEIAFLDEDTQAQYDEAIKHYIHDWFVAKDGEASLKALTELEDKLYAFKKLLADQYRMVFDDRRTGADIRPDAQ